MLKFLVPHKESHKLKKICNGETFYFVSLKIKMITVTKRLFLYIVVKPVLDDSAASMAAYPPLIKKVPNTAIGGTTRTISMPTLRLNEPIMTINRVSPIKRNNDQPQINTLNNNDNTNKEPIKKMPITNSHSGNYNSLHIYCAYLFIYINFCTCLQLYYNSQYLFFVYLLHNFHHHKLLFVKYIGVCTKFSLYILYRDKL